jgi:hypothetical protein
MNIKTTVTANTSTGIRVTTATDMAAANINANSTNIIGQLNSAFCLFTRLISGLKG